MARNYHNKRPFKTLHPSPCHWTRSGGNSWKQKVSYESEEEAYEFLNQNPRLKMQGYVVYQCPVCHKWHVGHINKDQKRIMPDIFITKNYYKVQAAKDAGFTTCSLQGSSRSGKTYAIVQLLCVWCHDIAKTTVSIIRAGMPSIKRTVYRDFRDVMIAFGWWEDKCMNKSEFVYTFPNGSWIEFFSTDNEQKVRGSKRKILFVNEANELSFIEWQQLQMRTTEFSILDYNPSFSEDHWINQVNEERSTYWFISTYKDNPFLEPKVIAEIESLKWKNPSLWRIYGLGLRSMVEGLIFKNVVIDDYIPIQAKRHHYRGMDFGYASDPTAIIDVYIYGKDIYVDEVCYQTQMLASDIIRVLKEDKENTEIISECADPRLIDEIYNAGIDIKPVKKFPGSIQAGIMKMLEYKIHITKRSINARREFNNYTWRQDKEGKWLNEPIDMYNHIIDSLRYVCMTKLLGDYGSGMQAADILGLMG